MIGFQCEDAIRRRVNRDLKGRFNLAKRLFNLWRTGVKNEKLSNAELPPDVVQIAVSMNIKVTRQFRSVIGLCERGEASDGTIVARSMFDTLLVTGFVLKRQFQPNRYKPDGTERVNTLGARMTREFRAHLYAAHLAFAQRKFANRIKNKPGLKRIANRTMKNVDAALVSHWENQIGSGWTRRLNRHPYTYSGLSISDLARSLGKPFATWYDLAYPFQCDYTHAADAAEYLDFKADGTKRAKWFSEVDRVCGCLDTAFTMFVGNLDVFNDHFELGVGMNSAIAAFAKEVQDLD